MALAIDASTPAIATQTTGTVATVATASFTPPSGSVLLIGWAANSATGADPTTPTITDNLGVHLTYSLVAHSHRADGPAADGQAAMWTAVVASSAAMTVTVTNGAASGSREAALRVWVLTGADTTTPVGASGKSGSTSAGSIAQNYTAQITGGQGFLADADWDLKGTQTAGTGTTRDGSANVSSAFTYGFFRRTSADDVNTVSNTINATLGGTSTNVRWVYAELRPATAATVSDAPIRRPLMGALLQV